MSDDIKVIHIPTKQLGTEVSWEGRPKKVKIDIYYDLDGEKIYEELLLDKSKQIKTPNSKIFIEP